VLFNIWLIKKKHYFLWSFEHKSSGYLGDGNTRQIYGYGDVYIMLNNGVRKQIPKELHVFGLMVFLPLNNLI